MILIKYSQPIGMFPSTQFWVATHRLKTTGVAEHADHNQSWENIGRYCFLDNAIIQS
jgi:hypothetical protein